MTSLRPLLPPRKPTVGLDMSLAIVNIVLLLILFFLATGAMMNGSTGEISPARSSGLALEQLPSPVLVVVGDGSLRLDDVAIERTALARALLEETQLHIVIAHDAPASELLDLLSQPGLEALQIDLVTVQDQDDP
jgi:biopolymer transport protein ExbD